MSYRLVRGGDVTRSKERGPLGTRSEKLEHGRARHCVAPRACEEAGETNRGKERTELTIEQLGVEEQLEGDEVPHNAENERGE